MDLFSLHKKDRRISHVSSNSIVLPNRYSFRLVRRSADYAAIAPLPQTPYASSFRQALAAAVEEEPETTPIEASETPLTTFEDKTPAAFPLDDRKRTFLKLAGVVGLGVVAASTIPEKAQAYVMGSSPTSGVVGMKDAANARINPATDEALQTLLEGNAVLKKTTSLSSSGTVHTPSSGKKVRIYTTKFSLDANMTSVSFRFTSGGTDFEKYVSPRTGGLYGTNNHPNYKEGGVDEAVYCVISGTGNVQINIDYLEV